MTVSAANPGGVETVGSASSVDAVIEAKVSGTRGRAISEDVARKAAARKRKNARMKVIRRVHMYFGLVLTPFVMLYGVTALLFNHPEWFGPGVTKPIESALFESIEIDDAETLASAAFAELSAASDIELTRPEGDRAVLAGDFLIDATGETERGRYRVRPSDLRGTVRRLPVTQEREIPFVASVDFPVTDSVTEMTARISKDAETDSLRVRSSPDVEFRVEADGEQWLVACDIHSGEITARPIGESWRPVDVGSFMKRLHTAHGYPQSVTARWGWAVIVDTMAAMMIFWALSGVLMWLQIKPSRFMGAIAAAGGVALAVVLGYLMLRLIYF